MNGPAPAPALSVVVACTRPERVRSLVQAFQAELDAGAPPIELLLVGQVAGVDTGALPAWVGALTNPDLHPNVLRQVGVDRAAAPVVAFLDDDALPSPGWVRAAVAMDPASREVWTGPEQPMRATPAAALAADVGSSLLAEGSMAHVEVRDREAHWYEVPFCNLVVGRSLLEELGPLPAGIPWDIDDFELCARARAVGARFQHRAALRIVHDRYPDTTGGWLARKARDRRRTGQKLVHHPGLYGRVPGVVVAAVAPWGLAGVLVALLARSTTSRRRTGVAVAAGAYVTLAALEAARSGRRGRDIARFVLGLAALHVASVPALQIGILEGLLARVAGRPDVASSHAPR